MSTLKMAIAALNADSKRWAEVSTSLNEAATAADGLDIYPQSFPAMADTALHPVYVELQTKVADLLVGGTKETHEVAEVLVQVRTILQGSDENAKTRLESTWDYE